jgi:hypothetical protein
MTLENDAMIGNNIRMTQQSLEDDILYDFNFNNRFIVDTKQHQQAYFYTESWTDTNEIFNPGPPSPSGGKYSLVLDRSSYLLIPNVHEQNTMTMRFWIFLNTANPDDNWKSLYIIKEQSTMKTNIEVKLWPSINRLQVLVTTSQGIEIIDTFSSLLPRKWYNIAVSIINNENRVAIYINGYLDPGSKNLHGNFEFANQVTNYFIGETNETKGVEAYIDRVQIYPRELEHWEITPAYSFMQSTRDLFIVHGCQSCTYNETELTCRSYGSSSIRINDQETISEYAMCTLEDLYISEGFNFARMMGWFKPYDKDDDSGTLWLRDLDQDISDEEKNRDRIGLCCCKVL